MASKKRGFPRKPGSKVRAHVVQRLRQYVGNKHGYSDAVGRKMLLALQRTGKKTGMASLSITPENIKNGGGNSSLLCKYEIKNNLYVVFGGDWSITNVLQEENKKR